MLLSQGSAQVGETTSMIMLCHEMKWDYWTYLSQPEWFVIGLRAKLNADAHYSNLQQKKSSKR